VYCRGFRTQRREFVGVVVGNLAWVHPADAVGDLLRTCECRLHRVLLIEQCTYENSEGILVQQGISCRITG